MAGEIHGIISREDAGRMWKPYGERCELDTPIDPANLTSRDLAAVLEGANNPLRSEIYWSFYKEDDPSTLWQTGLLPYLESDAFDDKTREKVIRSCIAQENRAAKLRALVLDDGGGLAEVTLFAEAIDTLALMGLFTRIQAKQIKNRLWGPDGMPFFELAPMSGLHASRLQKQIHIAEFLCPPTASADYGNGAVWVLAPERVQLLFEHNRIHERVHSDVEGPVIHDVTREDGVRMPQATTVGHFSYEPSTKIEPSDDFSQVRDVELGEGFTEFVAEVMTIAEPKLGRRLSAKRNGYSPWLETTLVLSAKHPKLFKAITDAALVEVTPDKPDAKKEALMRMHKIADRELGMIGALDAVYKGNKSIHDVHKKR